MPLVKIYVTLKKGVLDPQGKTVKNSLDSLGYSFVKDVRIGKYMEITVDETSEDEINKKIEEACKKLLANPAIENYSFEIVDNKNQ